MLALRASSFAPPALRQRGTMPLAAPTDDFGEKLTGDDLAKAAAEARAIEANEDALFASLKESFAALEGSTFGGAPDAAFADEAPATPEAELRAAASRMSSADRKDVDRAAIEAIFDRATTEFEDTVSKLREEDEAVGRIAAQELADEMAAEARAFETRMDSLVRASGVDPLKGTAGALADFDDDVLITMDSAVRAPPEPAAAAPRERTNGFRVAGAAGDADLQDQVRRALEGLGMADTDKSPDALVLVGSSEAEAKRLVETLRPARVVVASRQGVTRSGELAFFLRRKALDAARGVEGAAKLALAKLGSAGEVVVVRLGEAKGAAGPAVLEVEDALDAPTSTEVAAEALARCCADPRVANATVAVSGAESPSAAAWADLLVKADGPELLRLPAEAAVGDLRAWAREWAQLWTGGGDAAARLTTPVDALDAPAGADLSFRDKRLPKRSLGGGVLLRAEEVVIDGVASRRLRAVRGPYSEGVAVKQMSEDLILQRLGVDFEKTFG